MEEPALEARIGALGFIAGTLAFTSTHTAPDDPRWQEDRLGRIQCAPLARRTVAFVDIYSHVLLRQSYTRVSTDKYFILRQIVGRTFRDRLHWFGCKRVGIVKSVDAVSFRL